VKRIPRTLALTTLALAVAGLTGCSEFSEQTTTLQYAPADGTQLDLGDNVGVRNAILLSDGNGEPGSLLVTVYNYGRDGATVTFAGNGIDGSFPLDPGQVLMIGPEGEEQLRVDSVSERPGELVPLQVSAGSTTEELKVPVLDGTQPEFEELVPTATATASATPTETATAGATTSTATTSPTP
jgi:hypothetical protein